jgi:hypothetical protein
MDGAQAAIKKHDMGAVRATKSAIKLVVVVVLLVATLIVVYVAS